MRLTEPLLELFDYPIADILAALPSADDPLWDLATFRQAAFPEHAATRSIVFRWPTPGGLAVLRAPVNPVTAAVDRAAETIATHLGGRVVRVMLAELPSGGYIKEHEDAGDLTLVHRCHLPILTNDGAVLAIEGVPYRLKAGTVYEFDNTRPHAARNRGETRRVHLLCDVL